MRKRWRLLGLVAVAIGALLGYLTATGKLSALLSADVKEPAAPAKAADAGPAPGSPAYSAPIDGKQLPAPDPKFGGVIKDNAAQSKAWWAPRVVPPKGAPNVLLIMTDDVGFGAPSTFGGVIPTPALDRVAQTGLRYTCIPLHARYARRRARRSSPGATTTRPASAWSRSSPRASPATTASSRRTKPPSARS